MPLPVIETQVSGRLSQLLVAITTGALNYSRVNVTTRLRTGRYRTWSRFYVGARDISAFQVGSWAYLVSIQWLPWEFLREYKEGGHEANCSSPSSAKVEECTDVPVYLHSPI